MHDVARRSSMQRFACRALRIVTTAVLIGGAACSASSPHVARASGVPAKRSLATARTRRSVSRLVAHHRAFRAGATAANAGGRRGPRKVLWIGGIHGDEPQGIMATRALPGAFGAAGLGHRVTLTILEDDNPDGRALHTRDNANHVDLNRNFPARNFDATNPEYGSTALSQPESRALYNLIQQVCPELVIACHAFRGDQLINFDGPGAVIAAQFSALSGLRVEPSGDLGAGTPGSLGSLVRVDRRTVILTIEFLRGSDPSADWKKIQDAVLAVVAGDGRVRV